MYNQAFCRYSLYNSFVFVICLPSFFLNPLSSNEIRKRSPAFPIACWNRKIRRLTSPSDFSVSHLPHICGSVLLHSIAGYLNRVHISILKQIVVMCSDSHSTVSYHIISFQQMSRFFIPHLAVSATLGSAWGTSALLVHLSRLLHVRFSMSVWLFLAYLHRIRGCYLVAVCTHFD